MILDILLALLILNIMVIAHEFGHYLFARRNGIGVDEFAIGFGPVLLKKKWKGTIWLLKLFPLGGYNGLKGEAEEEKGAGNFVTAPKRAKMAVLFGGILMNILLAIVAFYISLGLYGWKVQVPVSFPVVGAKITTIGVEHPVVTGIVQDSPMSKVKVELPLTVIAVNDTWVRTPEDVINAVANSPTDQVTLRVEEGANSTMDTVTVTRDANKKIGIQIVPAPIQLDYSTSVWSKLLSGPSHVVNVTILTGKVLGSLISFSAHTGDLQPLGYAFAGPVAIVAAVNDVVKDSKTVVADLLNMTGLIGVSLAIFNLIPFPGLDGWHIFLVLYEKARGRQLNQKVVGIVSGLGVLFLLILGVAIMFKDVWLFFLKK